MRLKRNCLFFNAKVNEVGGTPDWEHTLGQSSPLFLLKEEGCSEIINGLVYNIKDPMTFSYGSGGNNYNIEVVSVFEKVNIKIYDGELKTTSQHTVNKPFIVILVKQTSGVHINRRLLKMSVGFSYGTIHNSDFYDAINVLVPNPWFGYKMEYDNLNTGVLTLTIIKAPILYPLAEDNEVRYIDKESRKKVWENLIEDYVEQFEVYTESKSKYDNKFQENLTNKNIIYYGAPGTGKSYKVDKIIENLDSHYYERITFHPEFDNTSFIGGYKPISEKDAEGVDIIKYQFVPQAFTNIYVRAWEDLDNPYFLVIEEINRGNCAEVFGEIFQLLDRNSNYTVTPSKELNEYLVNEAFADENHLGIANGLKLPPNLSILATMNTSDQSLFPMDSAFKRRWDWEYIPICYNPIDDFKKKNDSFDFEIDIEDGKKYSWIKFIEKINLNHTKVNPSLGMDKCIGNYFIKPDKDNIISLKPFINKVIFYLWNDVFKDEDNKVFEENTSYEDFFPIETNGKKKIKELLDRIDLKAIPSLEIVEDENPLGQVAESSEEKES